MEKSLEQWAEEYERKTKEKAVSEEGYRLFFLPDKGFCKIRIDQNIDALMIKETCGDGKFWISFAHNLAKEYNIHKMATFVCRNIKPYFRFFKWKIISENDGIYECKTSEGNKIEAYPYNSKIYFVVEYL